MLFRSMTARGSDIDDEFSEVRAGLAYGDVTVGGTPDALALTSTAGAGATVLCGNVQTANATVFVIDNVLLPTT